MTLPAQCNAVCAYPSRDDGDLCTQDDTGDCETVGCPVDRERADCSDGNQCTEDKCDPIGGCDNPNYPAETPCDDLGLCTVNDVCDGMGMCAGTDDPGCCESDDDCGASFCNGIVCQDRRQVLLGEPSVRRRLY